MPILVMKPIVSFTKDSACQCSHLPVSPFQLHGASTVRLPCGRALRIEYKAQQSRAALVPLPSDSSLCVVRTFNTAYFELRSPISAAQSRWADNPAKRLLSTSFIIQNLQLTVNKDCGKVRLPAVSTNT